MADKFARGKKLKELIGKRTVHVPHINAMHTEVADELRAEWNHDHTKPIETIAAGYSDAGVTFSIIDKIKEEMKQAHQQAFDDQILNGDGSWEAATNSSVVVKMKIKRESDLQRSVGVTHDPNTGQYYVTSNELVGKVKIKITRELLKDAWDRNHYRYLVEQQYMPVINNPQSFVNISDIFP